MVVATTRSFVQRDDPLAERLGQFPVFATMRPFGLPRQFDSAFQVLRCHRFKHDLLWFMVHFGPVSPEPNVERRRRQFLPTGSLCANAF